MARRKDKTSGHGTSGTKVPSCGAGGFDAYYANLFGERWARLREALTEQPSTIAWTDGLVQPYYLDAGSAAAALSLPLTGSEHVVDLCAAPGGKTLVLSSRLEEGRITANERSFDRRMRLLRVLDEHLDERKRASITVTGRDASLWSRYERDTCERILLDAPCSSERHVLSAPSYLAQWTPARVRNLSATQWALLSSAFLALAPGGYMIYSTCALSPDENDGVVARLMKKYPNARTEVPPEQPFAPEGERTAYGTHVLPDTSGGAGPLYYCLIRKDITEE